MDSHLQKYTEHLDGLLDAGHLSRPKHLPYIKRPTFFYSSRIASGVYEEIFCKVLNRRSNRGMFKRTSEGYTHPVIVGKMHAVRPCANRMMPRTRADSSITYSHPWLFLTLLSLTIRITFTATERAERDDRKDWRW
jgi:hypothetical protein